MVDFPYTNVTGRLGSLLSKMREVGVPPKVSATWLSGIGFKATNDPTMIPVLKFIGLIDDKSAPTEQWKAYRGQDYRTVLARAIQVGYKDLFSTYPDADRRDQKELEDFFKTRSSAGAQAITNTAQTFRKLCENAEFAALPDLGISEKREPSSDTVSRPPVPSLRHEPGVTVNINVQLTLPETTDAKVYENLFAAMKKHLLPGND